MTTIVDRRISIPHEKYLHLLTIRAELRAALEPDGYWAYRGESATIEHLREVLAEHESDRYRTAS